MTKAIRSALPILGAWLVGSAISAQPVPDDWQPLGAFESVEAFEAQLAEDRAACLANAGGGSGAVPCFRLHALWDRELNVQYERLRESLDADGREKLLRSQRDWLAFRDSFIALERHLMDVTYSAPGTMWIAIRAGDADANLARIVRERTLTLRDWRERVAQGRVDEETLLNE